MSKQLPPGVPYKDRQSISVQFQVNMSPEAEALVRQYAGGRKSAGRFLARLVFEHHARVEERARLQAGIAALVGAGAEREEAP